MPSSEPMESGTDASRLPVTGRECLNRFVFRWSKVRLLRPISVGARGASKDAQRWLAECTDRVGYIAGTIVLVLKPRPEANLRHDLAEDRT